MLRALVASSILAPALAAAQPGNEPPTETPPPFAAHFEYAARVGVAGLWVPDNIFDRSGTGPYLELEIARRFSPRFSLAAFASYLTVGDEADDGDFGYSTTYNRDRVVDVGLRARYHSIHGDGFVGGGGGFELVRSSGLDQCMHPDTPPCVDGAGRQLDSYSEPFTVSKPGVFVDVDIGVTVAKLGGVSIQLIGAATLGVSALTARAAAGLRL
jgi:hypothetical protein